MEPRGGVHHVSVWEHRTAVDRAEKIKYLVDVMYPDAEKIILVMDNLNTHKPSSLYKRYSPEEARRIIKKKAVIFIVVLQLLVAYLIEVFGVEKVGFMWSKVIGMVLAVVGIIIFKW